MKKTETSYGSLSEFEKSFPAFLKLRLGRGFFVSGKTTIRKDQLKYRIGNYFPDIVHDCKTNKRIIKFHRVDSVFVADVRKMKSGRVIVRTLDREEVVAEMEKRLDSITLRSENALLNAVYGRMIDIPSVQMAMTPVKEIITSVHTDGELSVREFQSGRGQQKASRYIEFLTGLGYITRDDGRLLPGENLKKYEGKLHREDSELFRTILSDILGRGYSYVRDYLHLTQIIPYLRVSNSYFLPSHVFGKLLFLSEEEIRKHYMFYYQKSRPLIKMKGQINDIIDAKILNREEDYVTGNRDIWKQYSTVLD
ncbi:MAG: hypothetical protein V3U09_08165 [Thermoplasmata archaeon]